MKIFPDGSAVRNKVESSDDLPAPVRPQTPIYYLNSIIIFLVSNQKRRLHLAVKDEIIRKFVNALKNLKFKIN